MSEAGVYIFVEKYLQHLPYKVDHKIHILCTEWYVQDAAPQCMLVNRTRTVGKMSEHFRDERLKKKCQLMFPSRKENKQKITYRFCTRETVWC